MTTLQASLALSRIMHSYTHPSEVVGVSVDTLERVLVVEHIPQVVHLALELGDRVALEVRQALQPLGHGEEAHLAGAHLVGQHEHDDVLRLDADVLAELLHALGPEGIRLVGRRVLPEPGDAALLREHAVRPIVGFRVPPRAAGDGEKNDF